jgi:geranylgeranyl diphosphate synthase type I
MSTSNALAQFFPSYHDKVQTELKEIVGTNPSPLYSMLRYHIGWQDDHGDSCYEKSGKFIRPTLCLLSCQAVGGEIPQILPAAAALELIHEFSLIHDDIEDASYERHHRPTVWKLWGQPQAINAGDCMLTLACLALLKLKENGIAAKKVIGSNQMLAEACLQLCEGQYMDIAYESRLDVTIEDYLNMIAKKTAILIATSTSLGAYLGTEDEKQVNYLYQFGKELGMVYQIHDDMLDIWGIKEKTGKSVSDISQRKKTLPVVYGLQNSQGKAKHKLRGIYSQEYIQGEDLSQVIKILEQLGAKDYSRNLAEQYYHRALAQLEATGLNPQNLAPLREAARFLMERDY